MTTATHDTRREERLAEIRDAILDLTVDYRPDGGPRARRTGAGLLAQLDQLGVWSTLLRPDGLSEYRKRVPGSVQPSADHIDHAARVRREALEWDMLLRRSAKQRPPREALTGVVENSPLATDDELRTLKSVVRRWLRTAEILCGYIDAESDLPHHYPGAYCLADGCGEAQIYATAATQEARCKACGTHYDRAELFNLIREDM